MKKKRILNKSFDAMRENIEDNSYGICPAPLPAQVALNILIDYLLGDDWYVSSSLCTEQVNALAVEHILEKYSKQWRDDCKYYEKNLT
jgi:hypothetical protein